MDMIFICSKYRGDIKKNVKAAYDYCRLAVGCEYIPVAPHTIFPNYINDDDEVERLKGIRMGLELMKRCKAVWVFGVDVSEGMELEIKKIAWNGLGLALESGEIDAIIAGMTANEEREAGIDFTTPYYDSHGMIIIVRKGSEVESFTDIQQFAGKRLVGQLNTINDEAIDQINGVVHSTPLATYPLMVLALTNGDVDGIVCQTAEAKSMMMSNSDLVMVTFSTEKGFDIDTTVSIALQEGTRGGEFFNAVQTALDSISDETRENWMVDAISKAPVEE